jgi:hypothetical protein
MLRPLVNEDPPRDRFEFWVRFTFSAIFGSIFALALVWAVYDFTPTVWLFMPAGALILGLAAAYWGDSFWRLLFGLLRWW